MHALLFAARGGHNRGNGPGGSGMELLERASFLQTLGEYAGTAPLRARAMPR